MGGKLQLNDPHFRKSTQQSQILPPACEFEVGASSGQSMPTVNYCDEGASTFWHGSGLFVSASELYNIIICY